MIGKISLIISGALFVFVIFTFIVWIPLEKDKMIKSFCEQNGYENFERGEFRWEKYYCVNEKNNTLIKKEIQPCNHRGMTIRDYCFVKEIK